MNEIICQKRYDNIVSKICALKAEATILEYTTKKSKEANKKLGLYKAQILNYENLCLMLKQYIRENCGD